MRKPILVLVVIVFLSIVSAQCSSSPKYSGDMIGGSSYTYKNFLEKYDTKLPSRSLIFSNPWATWPFFSFEEPGLLLSPVESAPIVIHAKKIVPASKIRSDIAKKVPIKYDNVTINNVIGGSSYTYRNFLEKYDTKLPSRSLIFSNPWATWPFLSFEEPGLFLGPVESAPIVIHAKKIVPASKIRSDIAKKAPVKYDNVTINNVISGSSYTYRNFLEKYDTKLPSRSLIFSNPWATWPFFSFEEPGLLLSPVESAPIVIHAKKVVSASKIRSDIAKKAPVKYDTNLLPSPVESTPIVIHAKKVVPASKICSDIATGGPVKYDNVIIDGNLNLNSIIINSQIEITNSEVQGDINFSDVVFKKSVNFSGVLFNTDPNFEHAWFKGGIISRGAKFNKDARFLDSQFNGFADLADIRFLGNADFTDAKFNKDVIFSDSQFSGFANFTDVQIRGNADFTGAKFKGELLADIWFKLKYIYPFNIIVYIFVCILLLVAVIFIYLYRKSIKKVSINESNSYKIMEDMLKLAAEGDTVASFKKVTRNYPIPRPEYIDRNK